jgi:hypothetical protein
MASYYRPPVLHPLLVCRHHHQHLERELGLRQGTRGPQNQGSQWLQGWGGSLLSLSMSESDSWLSDSLSELIKISRISTFVSCLLLKNVANATAYLTSYIHKEQHWMAQWESEFLWLTASTHHLYQ